MQAPIAGEPDLRQPVGTLTGQTLQMTVRDDYTAEAHDDHSGSVELDADYPVERNVRQQSTT